MAVYHDERHLKKVVFFNLSEIRMGTSLGIIVTVMLKFEKIKECPSDMNEETH